MELLIALWHTAADWISGEILGRFVAAVLMSGAATYLIRYLRPVTPNRELLYIFVPLLVGLFVLVFILNPLQSRPRLSAGLESITVGPYNNNRDTIGVATVSIQNSGSMQSIANNWSIIVKSDNVSYQAAIITPPPANFTFNSSPSINDPAAPLAITYKGVDSIVEKSLSPIVPGGQLTGVLFFIINRLDPSLLRPGAEYIISFQDIMLISHTASLRSTAIQSGLMTSPGLHSDLVCPVPLQNKQQ